MQKISLGRTGIEVSKICLGTMTWGSVQNDEADAHAQLDYAVLERGVDFLDTAELYAVPPKRETQGLTESYIGTWLKARGARDKVKIATKAAGPGGVPWIRSSERRLDAINMTQALEDSLKRLQTDYIDLYQLHWPERPANRFGRRGYVPAPRNPNEVPLEDSLEVLDGFVKDGKVRAIGLSNETPWGTMHCLHLAETKGLPRVATVQNPYSLINRTYEVGLAEVGIQEDVGLLAYAPLGAGALSGKYLDGQMPAGSRRAIDYRSNRYDTPNAEAAIREYVGIARRHGLDPCQMALAFILAQPFVACPIIGATKMDQLKTDIDSIDVTLSDEVMAEIEAVQVRYPDPCP